MTKNCLLFLLLILLFSCSNKSDEADSLPLGKEQNIHFEKAEGTGIEMNDEPVYKKPEDNVSKTESRSSSSQVMRSKTSPVPELEKLVCEVIQSKNTTDPVMLSKASDQIVMRQESGTFTSLNSYFIIDFENDIFTNTDYYFTNGAQLSIILPTLQHFYVSKIMPSAGKNAMNHYKLSLRQNMYTPINPEATEIDFNDRPFAGIMLMELSKISTSHKNRIRISTGFQLGTIGKSSLAEAIQQNMHELEPIGWKYQISEDLLINLAMKAEKAVVLNRHHELIFFSKASLGTYLNEIEGGFMYKTGILSGTFNPFPIAAAGSFEYLEPRKPFRICIFIEGGARHNFFNATFEGGFFNHHSPYVIENNRRIRNIAQLTTGVELAYRRTALQLKLVYLSPEFKGGFDHRWGAISILQNLNK